MDPYQEQILQECASRLGDAFQGALILVSHKPAGGGGLSTFESRSRGDDFAAIGMAQFYLKLKEAELIGDEIKLSNE